MRSSNLSFCVRSVRSSGTKLLCGLLLATGLALPQAQSHRAADPNGTAAQSAQPESSDPGQLPTASSQGDQVSPRGWPRADERQGNGQSSAAQSPVSGNSNVYNDSANDGERGPAQPTYEQTRVPAQLTIQPGTFVNVRIDQQLSSDKNHPGDSFTATLAQPIIVNGIVVAQRGQTVAGKVGDAQKAGRVEGVSRLALQLTEFTLVDGQQLPVDSQFVSINGQTSHGRDAAAIGGTTAAGAAIGAAAEGGRGAGIGAAAGAVASTVGVLLTRGHATVVYPEAILTFRTRSPIIVATDRAPEAFRYASSTDYSAPEQPARAAYSAPSYGCGPYGCAAPPPPYYYYGPSYYPGFAFYGGPGFFYGPRYYYRPGLYRGYGGRYYGGYSRHGFRR